MQSLLQLTLRAKLWLSVVGMGLVVAMLLLLGEQIIESGATALDEAVREQVKPLAKLNGLQAQVSRIRVQEAELPRTSDLFAMSDKVEMLDNEIRDFDRSLRELVARTDLLAGAEYKTLVEVWQRYRLDLEAIGVLARALQNDRIAAISTFESSQRFDLLARTLRTAADRTAALADERAKRMHAERTSQRTAFVLISTAGMILLAAWLALLARHLSRRLAHLTRAAAAFAGGQRHTPIAMDGGDELAELAQAFNVLQQRVDEREAALRLAHDELETRVALRTAELHTANQALTHEVDVRRRAEQQLQYQAQYDSLTGLPNRLLAMDRLQQAIRDAQRASRVAGVIFLDLDDFKRVNDNFGHGAGDALLTQSAGRLQKCIRSNDTLGRLGGDEFVIILGGLHTLDDAGRVAENVIAAFGQPFVVGADEFVVTPSLGVASYPLDGDDAPTLLRHADQAMYEAKGAGRNTYRYFNSDIRERSAVRVALEGRLRGALERQEFHLAIQPLMSPDGLRVVGAEALLRWRTADGQVIRPDQFIPVAESTGLIIPIGRWVIDEVCATLADWRRRGHGDLYLSLNISPRQFRDAGLADDLKAGLARHHLPARSLCIEVTEGLLLGQAREVQQTLEAVSAMGIGIAMDDFGTGYSSLSYLKRYPFDVIKIDRSFVNDIVKDADSRALVGAAIRMGQALGLRVVAEGVETEAQLTHLRELGCDLMQGYLFGMPATTEAFAARWLHDRPAAPAAIQQAEAPALLTAASLA